MLADLNEINRISSLLHVARSAAKLGFADEAKKCITDAQALERAISTEAQRQHLASEFAVAWIRLDPAQTEKWLSKLGSNSMQFNMAIYRIVQQLSDEPERAVAWLDRFRPSRENLVSSCRSELALRLGGAHLPKAMQVAEGIDEPVTRCETMSQLASLAHKSDPKLALALFDKALRALAAERQADLHSGRDVYAVDLVCRGHAIAYPDRGSLIAAALTCRHPVSLSPHAASQRYQSTLSLAEAVSRLDPATGRLVLALATSPGYASTEKEIQHPLMQSLVFADPAAAAKRLDHLTSAQARHLLYTLEHRCAHEHSAGFDEDDGEGY
jgi:hypothetical protein